MKLNLDSESPTPVFQQIIDQIHFAINTGEIAGGERLPSIRSIAAEYSIASNTVAKALRQLEFRGLIAARDRSGYTSLLTSRMSPAASAAISLEV